MKTQTYTWFWVRTSLPKRVWNRCMEYKVKSEGGDMISYRLLDGDTTPEKVTDMESCMGSTIEKTSRPPHVLLFDFQIFTLEIGFE